MKVTVNYYTGESETIMCESLIYEDRCLVFMGKKYAFECIELKHVDKVVIKEEKIR